MEHRLLRRATRNDLIRLSVLAAAVSDERRRNAIREYVADLTRVFDCQNRFLRTVLWPTLSASAGVPRILPYVSDVAQADGTMRAATLADAPSAERAGLLTEAARSLSALLSAEDLHLQPLLDSVLPPSEQDRLQLRFRRDLPPGLLAFLIPWAMRHADAAEASRLLAGDDPAMSVALTIFGERFALREELVFGGRDGARIG